MLILSRKQDEVIRLQCGKHLIDIMVVEISQHKIRLGVTAPPEVTVDRLEIWENKHQAHQCPKCEGGNVFESLTQQIDCPPPIQT